MISAQETMRCGFFQVFPMGGGTVNGMSRDASEFSVTPVTTPAKPKVRVTGARPRGQFGNDGLPAEVRCAWRGEGVLQAHTGTGT